MDFDSAIAGPIKGMLLRLITDNLPYLALGVLALIALGAGCGLLKKLAAGLVTGALAAGDAAARKIAERPKAVILAAAIAAIALPAAYAGYRFASNKIVEKPVIQEVEVIRYATPSDPTGELQKLENARRQAEAQARAAEARVAAEAQARKEAETQAATLARQLADLSPPEGDEKALERLSAQIDAIHASGVKDESPLKSASEWLIPPMPTLKARQFVGYDEYGREVWRDMPDPAAKATQANYRNFRSYTHKYLDYVQKLASIETPYHRGCRACDQNYELRLKMDAIYPRLAAAARQPRVVFRDDGLVERIFPKTYGEGMEHKLYTKREYNAFLLEEKAKRDLLEREATAFGETKPFSAWIDDPRCKADKAGQIARRLDRGWQPEEAIATHYSSYGDDTKDKEIAEAKRQREKEAEAKKRQAEYEQLVRQVEEEVKQGNHACRPRPLSVCPCYRLQKPAAKQPAQSKPTTSRLTGGR
jgi:hypothetical protein